MEIKQLGPFEKKLLKMATKEFPKESLKITRKMGAKARTLAAKNGRKAVKKRTGNYNKSWKRGKAYKRGRDFTVSIHNTSPHGHLIERGHRIVDKSGKEIGFQKGLFVLENSIDQFAEESMDAMLDEWLDELLDKGL